MKHYYVTGMSCAACQARVEKAVSRVPRVESCSVSLLTNSMGVEGSASPEDIIKAVSDAGYGAAIKAQNSSEINNKEIQLEDEVPVLKKRLIASLLFLVILMYISMGHTMWNWPLPDSLAKNHIGIGLIQMVLSGIVIVINQKFFTSGFKGLIHRAPNMDTLVALGSFASFGWSIYVLFAMTDAVTKGNHSLAMSHMHNLYFESAAMILTLITVGKLLEARAKGKTTDALKSLMKLAPETAILLRDGREVLVPISEVGVDDIFVVKSGDNIPVDGVVIEGTGAVNESALTGESVAVDKVAGDRVSAATVNESGYMTCRATHVGEDTTLSKIIKMVSDAAATKAPIAKIADKVSGVFVPVVIGIALITLIIWLLVGQTAGYALARAIAVLVISCPCALGLATPVAIMVGNGVGAKNGILFKTAVSLEETGRVDIVALDKTGTITMGEPRITDVLPSRGVDVRELIEAAYALEKKSEHPLAKAIITAVEEDGLASSDDDFYKNLSLKRITVEDFKVYPGNGLVGKLKDDSAYANQSRFNGYVIAGGNGKFISDKAEVEGDLKVAAEKLAEEGKTCLYFSADNRLLGIIAVADVMKDDSPRAIKELKDMGIEVVMLTGDNERTAKAIGREAGVDRVIAGVLPDGKEEVIKELQQNGKVAMVGDGINDAPALTRADMGIAIGAGADVAVDAADVVLMNSKLTDVSAAVRLSRATLKNIHQNLFWAFFYNVIGIPLAAGALIKPFGLELSPMFGAAAMSLSSFFVVTNALRLNLFNIYGDGVEKKQSVKTVDIQDKMIGKDGGSKMTKTMTIEGMMCGHCEAAVKQALEALEGVETAEVSHEKGTALVTVEETVTDEVLTKAVEDKEYKVLGIE